jgi:hypothetical protein
MYKLWNVVVNGNWVGTVTASSYENASIDAVYEFGLDARPVLAKCKDN